MSHTLDAIYRVYYATVYRTVRWFGVPDRDAEDVTQIEELSAVREILRKLESVELSPLVTELGLTRIVDRLKKLADKYETAQKAAGTLEFGLVRAAREQGQHLLLQAVAIVIGTYHEPDGDSAKLRGTLLLPILKQNAAISAHFTKTRRTAPDVDPTTGEEKDSELDEDIPEGAPDEKKP